MLAVFPAVGERLLEREDFGYSAWAFLLSPRDGSRKQSPPTPADDAWHCSMLSKPQRFSGFSQARQCGEEVLRMLVTGGPPARGGGGIPQRIMVSSRSAPALRTRGAG